MRRLGQWIATYSGWNALVHYSKVRKFPGHEDITVYAVISFLFKELRRDSIATRTASVAYSFFISLFPTILFFFTLIPYIPIPGFQQALLTSLNALLPSDVNTLLTTTVHDIVTRHQGGLLSISIVLAFYFSTRGVLSLMNAFDKALPSFTKRSFFVKQLVALEITGLLFLLVTVTISFFLSGEWLTRAMMQLLHVQSKSTYIWFSIIRWLLTFLIIYLSLSFIYFFGPARHKKWIFFTAGSTLACILFFLFSLLFSEIINQFGQYNKVYGSLGTFLVVLLWIYYNSMSIILGFELNASIEFNKQLRTDDDLDDLVD